MKRCPTCDQVAELSARGLKDGDLHGRMLDIAALVTHEKEEKPPIPEVERLYDLFIELQGREPRGIRAITSWKDAIRLMKTADKISYEEIEEMIRWVAQDVASRGSWHGWKYQIISPPNLRRHREKIQGAMSYGKTTILPCDQPQEPMEF